MHPYRAHDDIGLDSRPVIHRLGIGPDMERKVRCGDGVVGRVEKGTRVDEKAGDGHRYQQCCEDMPCSVSPISTQCAPKRVGWWQQRGLGRPSERVEEIPDHHKQVHRESPMIKRMLGERGTSGRQLMLGAKMAKLACTDSAKTSRT